MLLCTRTVPTRDKEHLIDALTQARSSWVTYAPYLDYFRSELRRANGVPPSDVPSDMVTMNSRFVLRDEVTDEQACFTLVYPGEEAPLQGRISALSPMGMAVFGARVGDEVSWISSDGPRAAKIAELIYQPESAGDHHR